MRLDEGEYLAHYGILRKSGRYPWGSGENPHQRSKTFLQITEDMKKSGMSEAEIARAFHDPPKYPFTVNDLRAIKSRAVNMQKREQIRTAQKLQDKGMGASAIARQMNLNESTVRSLLEPGRLEKLDILETTANMLKQQVEEKGYVDVGANVNRGIGISADKLKTALSMLKEEGYSVHPVNIPQVGTGDNTKFLVLSKHPQTKEGQRQVFLNRDKIRQITEKSEDGGRSYTTDLGISPPLSIHPNRVAVRYKEQGGADADGVIYVRPGVPDVSLGKAHYAQVRIQVGEGHFLKGMAVYKADLPDGVDLMFNTNKSDTGNKLNAMKELKRDKDTGEVDKGNPFGAVIKLGGQLKDKDGNVTSAMNLVNEEGDWNKWSKNISRQVLSKQSHELAKAQLAWTHEKRQAEFEELKSLTNPVIRKKLLENFAEETDSAAVHLKAAHMPRQANKVILPANSVKPTEIFAPTFRNGERVVLVRYPHAGTFELPELTVNNKNPEARKLLGIGKGGTGPDAVVIHPKVAERLSGADFDGDAVVVIPNDRGKITTTHPLDGLKGFDHQALYKPYDGMKTIDGGIYNEKLGKVEFPKGPDGKPRAPKSNMKGNEMGNITNLISDMTLKGANTDELARAVRHSMVVIDSEKHTLDYKASERDHGIIDLKRRYQGVHESGQVRGAATLITRATAQTHVPKRRLARAAEGGPVNKVTGKKQYVYTDERKPNGELATFRSKKLAETDDAHTLVSDHGGTRIENIYADHSNRLKAMANEARREAVNTELPKASPSAKKVYAKEVESLNAKLDLALRNSPLERQAQVVANHIVGQRMRANPDMERAEKKKIKGQALTAARIRTGAGKTRLGSPDSPITPREWDAIQAHAISKTQLTQILNNSDIDRLRELATPHVNPVMTTTMTSRARQMLNSGYTPSEVADDLGIKLSTLTSAMAEGGG